MLTCNKVLRITSMSVSTKCGNPGESIDSGTVNEMVIGSLPGYLPILTLASGA